MHSMYVSSSPVVAADFEPLGWAVYCPALILTATHSQTSKHCVPLSCIIYTNRKKITVSLYSFFFNYLIVELHRHKNFVK